MKNFKLALISIILLSLVTSIFGRAGYQSGNDEKNRSGRLALACELAAESRRLREENPLGLEQSVLLAIESRRIAWLAENDETLRASLDLLRKPLFTVYPPEQASEVKFSHDGRRIITMHRHGLIEILDAAPPENDANRESRTGTEIYPWAGMEIYPWKISSDIQSFDLSQDDRYLAAGTSAGVRILDTANNYSELKSPITFHGPASSIFVAFAPNGHRLAVASANRARVYDIDYLDKPPLELLQGARVSALTFSPNGRYVATGSDDGFAIFESSTGRKLEFSEHNSPAGEQQDPLKHIHSVDKISFSSDSLLVAAAGKLPIVMVLNIVTRKWNDLPNDGVVRSLSFSPAGSWLAVGCVDSKVRAFDAATGLSLPVVSHNGTVNAVSFSPNGRWLASAGSDQTVRVIDWQTRKPVEQLTFDAPVRAISFGPDSRFIAGITSNGQLRKYPVLDYSEILRQPLLERPTAVDLTPDGQLLAVGTDRGDAQVYDLNGTSKWPSKHVHQGPVSAMAFSPDNAFLATGDNSSARIFQARTGNPVRQVSHKQAVNVLTFDPDSRSVLTGTLSSADTSARIFGASVTGKDLIPPVEHELTIQSVAFSPDGQFFATGSWTKTARIFNAKTGEELIVKPLQHGDSVMALKFYANHSLLITGSKDGSVRIFETNTGNTLNSMLQGKPVTAMDVNEPEQLLVTAGSDGLVRFWRMPAGQPIGKLDNKDTQIKVVRFSPNDQLLWTIAIGTDFVSVRRYFLRLDDLIHTACMRLTRNLTSQEWNYYFPGEPRHKACSAYD